MGALAVPGQGAQDPSSSELAWLPLSRTLLLCPNFLYLLGISGITSHDSSEPGLDPVTGLSQPRLESHLPKISLATLATEEEAEAD